MWNQLDKEDQEYLINAFKADGFKVHNQSREMVAEKNGQKIIVRDQTEVELVLDMKRIFEEKKVLFNRVGNIPVEGVLEFLRKEKKEKETSYSTLFRIHEKFNWGLGMYGEYNLDREWKSLGEKVSFATYHTDQADQSFLAVSFVSEKKGERLYFLNMGYFPFLNFIERFSPMTEFNNLAPSAFIKLRAYSVE